MSAPGPALRDAPVATAVRSPDARPPAQHPSPWLCAATGMWSRWSGGVGVVTTLACAVWAYASTSTSAFVPAAALVLAVTVWGTGVIILGVRGTRAQVDPADEPDSSVNIPALVLLTSSRFQWGIVTTALVVTILTQLRLGVTLEAWLGTAAIAVGLLFGFLMLIRYLRLEYEIDEETPKELRLFRQVYEECYGMAMYATQRGLPTQADDLEHIAAAARYFESDPWSRSRGRSGASPRGVAEARARAGDVVLRDLAETHERLAALVAPAMPKTLQLLSYPKNDPIAPWLGPIRLTRMLVGLSIVLIPSFLLLAITVGTDIDVGGLFPPASSTADRGVTAAYLLVGSALGATFAALFKAFRYIEDLSYDDKHEPSYWVRWILGVVSGLILSIVIAQSGVFPPQQDGATGFRLTIPLLAIAGGFSSDLVYRILERIVEAVQTLVQGSSGGAVRYPVDRPVRRGTGRGGGPTAGGTGGVPGDASLGGGGDDHGGG